MRPDILPVILAHALPALPALEALRSAWPDLPDPLLIRSIDDPAAQAYAKSALDTLAVDPCGEARAYAMSPRGMPPRSLSPHLAALARISADVSSGFIFALRGDATRFFWRVCSHATDHFLPVHSLRAALSAACAFIDHTGRTVFFRSTSGGICGCLFRANTPPTFAPDPQDCFARSFQYAERTATPWMGFPLPVIISADSSLPPASDSSQPLTVPEDC